MASPSASSSAPPGRATACAVDPVHVITGEVHYMLTALKLTSRRWAAPSAIAPLQSSASQQLSSSSSSSSTPLLQDPMRPSEGALSEAEIAASLYALIERLDPEIGIDGMDPMVYLRPFMEVVICERISGPVTGVALSSLLKIVNNVLLPTAPGASSALASLAVALSNCRFEASDADSDQATLSKLLRVILCVAAAPVGQLLPDSSVVQLFDTCLRIAVPHNRSRQVSPVLRALAENALVEFVQSIFARFPSMPVATQPSAASPAPVDATQLPTEGPHGTACLLAIMRSVASLMDTNPRTEPPSETAAPQTQPLSQSSTPQPTEASSVPSPTPSPATAEPSAQRTVSAPPQQAPSLSPAVPPVPPPMPASTPTATATVTAATSASPKLRAEAQFLALNAAAAVVETLGASLLRVPAFTLVLQRELAVSVIGVLTTSVQPAVVALALRVLVNLFTTCRTALKLQMEMFIAACFKLALDSQGNHMKHTELVLQTLHELARDRMFVVELYANYDCDIHCSNLLGNLAEFLYKAAFPRGGSLTPVHQLALDALLAMLASLCRCIALYDSAPSPPGGAGPDPETQKLRRAKQQKRVLGVAVDRFSKSADDTAVAFLVEQGILQDPSDSRGIATFIRLTPGLDRNAVGKYLEDKSEFHQAVLREYVRAVPLAGVPFITALRGFMESFYVPGDAAVLARLLEAFSSEYYAINSAQGNGGGVFRNADACYVCTYSSVILNVDLHNAALKNHMTLEQFVHNNRGLNDHENFPREFLVEIYRDIWSRPFTIPEDFASGNVTRRTCEDLINRSAVAAPYYSPPRQSSSAVAVAAVAPGAINLYRDAFATVWNPLIATLSVCFEAADDEAALKKVLTGFHSCGVVASRYKLCEVIDFLVVYLCKASSLPLPPGVENHMTAFGLNRKAHFAAVAAFTLAHQHPSFLRESWVNVFGAMAALHAMDLLPDIPDMPDVQIDPAEEQQQQRSKSRSVPQQRSQQGWLSALLWGSEPQKEQLRHTDEDAEAMECAKRCAAECRVFDVVDRTKDIDDASLACVLKALVHCSARDPSADDEEPSLFCLDLLTKVTLLNSHRLGSVWPTVCEHLCGVLASASSAASGAAAGTVGAASSSRTQQQWSAVHTERAAVDALLLCIHLCTRPEVQRDLATVLWTLAGIPSCLMADVDDAVSLGVLEAVRSPAFCAALGRTGALSALFSLIRGVSCTRSGSSRAFEALIVTVGCESLTFSADEYALCIGAVTHFARASRVIGEEEEYMEIKKQRERQKSRDAVALRCIELLHSLFFRGTSWDIVSQPLGILVELSKDLSVRRFFPHQRRHAIGLPCTHFCSTMRTQPEIRHAALTTLQRLLLSPSLDSMPAPVASTASTSPQQEANQTAAVGWAAAGALRRIVFPLMADLLRPLAGGKEAANESRVRVCSLLTKYLLQHLTVLSEHADFTLLWTDCLGYLEQYAIFSTARHTASDVLAEALPELLKNLLLVMAASSVFDQATPRGKELWALTARAVGHFLPGIAEEISAKMTAKSQSQSQAVAKPAEPPPQSTMTM